MLDVLVGKLFVDFEAASCGKPVMSLIIPNLCHLLLQLLDQELLGSFRQLLTEAVICQEHQ